MGLSTVYGIEKQSGGSLDISSELGRGTTFRIYLPLIEAPVDTAVPDVHTEALSQCLEEKSTCI